MRSFQWFVAVLLLGVAGGSACITTVGLHAGMHPSIKGDGNAAGVNTGLIYATTAETDSDDESMLQVPYGEGIVRFGVRGGQLELRMTTALTYASYRINLTPGEESYVGLALIPSLGMGYWRAGSGSGDSDDLLALAPNVALLVAFNEGTVYLTPRIGYIRVEASGRDGYGRLVLGANIGYAIDGDIWDVLLELGFQRVTSTEGNGGGAIYFVAPTVGIQL